MQPSYNIGLVGHVSHGKSTCCKVLTGVETFKHSKEKEKGITMKIGYTNCKIFKCSVCPEPQCYNSSNGEVDSFECSACKTSCELVQYFSFVDCPGHESLMSSMLSGTTVIDYAILMIDGSQPCPQPQTVEHLAVLEMVNVRKIIITQNKLDLVDSKKAIENYNQIKSFVKGSCAENSPIIPISAQKRYNIDILIQYIDRYFGNIERSDSTPKMNIIRSFDVNKPGTDPSVMVGGVLGGTLLSGEFKVGDMVEIRPGLVMRDTNNNLTWKPIKTSIVSMKTDNKDITMAKPGGLIGVCTNIDPVLTRVDRMVGHVVGLVGCLPDVKTRVKAKCLFMKRANEKTKTKLSRGDNVVLNITSKPVRSLVKFVSGSIITFELSTPCCVDIGEKISISTKNNESWRLTGMGTIIN